MEAKKLDDLEDDKIKKVISNSLLFKGADDQVIDLVIKNLEHQEFTKGTPVFLENELNDKVFFIKSGEVEIVYFQKDFNRMNQAAILKSGSYFAEFSVLTKGNTSASAIAHEDCEILSLSGERFIQILGKYPKISKNLAINLGKMVDQFVETHSYITYFNEESLEVNNDILNYFPINYWKKLNCIPLNMKGNILAIASMTPRDISVQEFFAKFNDIKVEIHLINQEDYTGQIETLTKKYQKLRSVSSATVTPGEKLDQKDDEIKDTILHANPLFSLVPEKVKAQLSKYLKIKQFKAGEQIYSCNTSADCFYILAAGEASIYKHIDENQLLAKVASLKINESFGVIPILLSKNRFLSAIAMTDGCVAEIPNKIFNQLIGQAYFSVEVARNMAETIQFANKQSGLEYYDDKNQPDFSTVKTNIPWDIIENHQIIPLEQNNKQVTLGVVNPDSHLLYSTLGRYLINLKVNVFILSEDQFNNFLPEFKKYYDKSSQGSVDKKTNTSNIVDLVFDILADGTKNRASDVHVEPSGENLVIRYRIDGVLKESPLKIGYPTPGLEVLSRLKIMAKMDISNKLTPQDGQIVENIKGTNVFARASAMPLKNGEKIVLRLIPEKVQVPPLSSLTTDRSLYQILQKVVKCRQGLFLITGPTGSGKTTTLYSLLHELNSIELNVVTVEDPVELEIPGINQLEINVKQNMTFAAALKAILRQDPDCIMIGEIRDKESAEIALEAAMTGHLVLSTLHTPSSLGVIPRLRDLGIEKSLISSGLIGAMTQKLVRKVCSHCIEENETTEEEKKFIEQYLDSNQIPAKLKMGKGCDHCGHTGYLGRIPVFEGWCSSKDVQDLIYDEAHLSTIKTTLQNTVDFHDLGFNAMKMATLGQTTIEEVKRVLGLL